MGDGKWLMSNCAGREILYWNAETGKQDRDALGKRDIAWGMTTCVFGWPTQGVWRPSTEEEIMGIDYGYASTSQAQWVQTLRGINAKPKKAEFNRSAPATKTKKVAPKRIASVCQSFDKKLLVSADDKRRVALYRYPSLPDAEPRLYAGHGFPAASVAWTYKDEYVVSAGGNDCTILIWKHVKAKPKPTKKEKKAQKRLMLKQEPTYTIEEAWKKLEDVDMTDGEQDFNKNIDIKWNYLEDDAQIHPPKALNLPDLSNQKPQFKPMKPKVNRRNKPKPQPPPRKEKVKKNQNDDEITMKEQTEAAKKIQAIQRGKADRKKVEELKEQTEAAKKIQAIQRGKADRKKVEELKKKNAEQEETEKEVPVVVENQKDLKKEAIDGNQGGDVKEETEVKTTEKTVESNKVDEEEA